jgi:hypothetical protein
MSDMLQPVVALLKACPVPRVRLIHSDKLKFIGHSNLK